MADDLFRMSAFDLREALRSRRLSPKDVVQEHLKRIESINPLINAFVTLTPELALAAADRAEDSYRRGSPAALEGLPTTVKDSLMVAGVPFRRGSKVTPATPSTDDAPVVASIRREGAALLGVTTLPEFGAGPVTISPLTGVTRNPWNLAMNAGGSSGGAAASIAAGIGVLALATDAGGSSRIPAALCGVVGFKPTGGRLPTWPPNVAGTLSVPGLIARDVRDIAMLFDVVNCTDARDAEGLPPRTTSALPSLSDTWKPTHKGRPLRIALSTTLGFARKVEPQVAACVRAAARHFESLGCDVEEVDPGIEDPVGIFLTLFRSGFAYTSRNFDDAMLSQIGPELRQAIEVGREIRLFDYMAAQDARRAYARTMQQFHERYDVVLTPTTAAASVAADRWVPEGFEEFPNSRAWVPFASLFNLTQQPAITVPAGLTTERLPIGLQIAAARFDDDLLLQVAHLFTTTNPQAVGYPPLESTSLPK